MKRLPLWIVAVLAVLTVMMIWAGWQERHEAGVLPVTIGLVWLAITVASVGRIAASEGD
ncbi:MAG: hypothetical protein OEM67_09385 [Thermoleophilia bacterium]|nr:hypothetical protein [Thermoleophilia bacterium]